MTDPIDTAKEALARLARERRTPVPAEFCGAYRALDSHAGAMADICPSTRALADLAPLLLAPWRKRPTPAMCRTGIQLDAFERALRSLRSEAEADTLRRLAETLGAALHAEAEQAQARAQALQTLTASLAGTVATLAADDASLRAPMLAVQDMLQEPLTLEAIERAGRYVRGIATQQQALRGALGEAQQTLQRVMAQFLDHAGTLAHRTAGAESEMARLSASVREASDAAGIRAAAEALEGFVTHLGTGVHSAQRDLGAAHERMDAAERQIGALREKLAESLARAQRDPLTGAINRQGLEEAWARLLAQAHASGLPLSLGIVDLDDFKRLNDTWGHVAGDDALVHVATVMREALRGADVLARYGGEEFVVLLPDADVRGAQGLLRRVQRDLARRPFDWRAERVPITFSAGVTGVRAGEDSLRNAVERADAALYDAKHSGKNRVCQG